jgi:RHS repeat-associated protein
VTRVVDRNSRKRDFTYNDLGLVTSEVWVDGFGNAVKTIVHGYDDAGREISISDGVTAYQYQYDLADRVTYTDNAGSVDMPQVQLRSHYDYEGNRVWLGDSQGGSVWYAWNNQRLQSMAMYTGDYKSAQVGFSYDPVGRLSSLTRTANGDFATTINTGYTLDLLDRVTSITHSKGMGEDASTLSQFTYGYDVGGRVVGSTGPEGSLSFALDANGQLLSVTGSRSEDYAFDATGNRTSNSTAAGNLLLNDGQYSYTYDLEGNQKTKTRISDGQLTEYFWDHRNQLTKAMVKDANGTLLKELRFTYDVEGRRVGEWVDADGAGPEEPDQVWTVFDGVNPYMDFDGEGELQTRYLYGPGIDELFARIGTGEEDPQWYLADRLGSVRQIVGASGAVLDEISYDSFGGILSESNPSQGDRFKFTGREYSPELGIYYYRARWYDPGSGRFISQDPIGFSAGDPNLYRYVGNAPGDATDPLGKSPTLISGGIGAAGGFVIGGAIGWWNGSGFWSGAGHGFVVGGVTGLTAGAGAWLFGGTATTTMVGGTAGGFFGGVASDAVGQGVEIGLGWREEYSFFQSGVSGLFGSIFGAGPTIWNHCRNIRKPFAQNQPLMHGSTGRFAPTNLKEQLAFEQAVSNPEAGRQLGILMTDPRWLASDGWVKMARNINGVEIHYLHNTITGAIDDFKFVP